MDFIHDISDIKSLAIVGLEKNTGKTECLNYILGKMGGNGRRFGLTSIGIDGESRDQVCQTPKPEIEVPEGMIFVTSEKHFREKRLVAEVVDVLDERTALGRLVVARAVSRGKVLLSGPSDTVGLKRMIEHLGTFGVETTIVDGALSRLSLASPAVTEAMVLATGAAVSANIPELVRKTRYVYELIRLEEVEATLKQSLELLEQGVWGIDDQGEIRDLNLPSVFMLERSETDVFRYGHRLYVAGAVGDKLLRFLKAQKESVELIVRDFTKVFATPEIYYAFLRKGGVVRVVHRSRLLAVTINPQAPSGIVLDSVHLQQALEESLGVRVFDVRRS